MLPFLARRLLLAVPLILGIIAFNFFLLQLAPGDLADVLASEQGGAAADAGYVAELRKAFGLDLPVLTHLGLYLKNVATLDFGFSHRYGVPVASLITARLGGTLLLAVTSLVLAVAIGAALGLLAARHPGGIVDGVVSVLATMAYSAPLFWVGLMLVVLFGVHLQWLPTGGMQEVTQVPLRGLELWGDRLRHLILPATTLALFAVQWRLFPVEGQNTLIGLVLPTLSLALPLAGFLGQALQDEFTRVLEQPFVTSARMRGMSDLGVRLRHVLRHAVLPGISLSGWAIGKLFSGAVLIEAVFARQGIGGILVSATAARDVPLVSGIILLSAAIYVAASIIVDRTYSIIDPRIKLA